MTAGEVGPGNRPAGSAVTLPCGHIVALGEAPQVMGLFHLILEHQQDCRGASRPGLPLWAGPASPLDLSGPL
jgi:hypothetical protein